jgi:two-component system sensor histidine kinase PilS (NtrC family)
MRPAFEGPPASLWFLGVVRIGVLFLATVGTFVLGENGWLQWDYLLAFYVFGLASSLWYLFTLRRSRTVPPLLTGAQLLVDFCVVAATVSFTGGPQSFLTFLFVVVILEAGLLMGVLQSFLFASLAAAVMFAHTASPPMPLQNEDILALWYNYIVEALAFYLTASISGYWNQRVRRMQQFQHEILDNLNSGFLIADRMGVIISSNKAADAILELEAGWAAGRPAPEVLRVQSGAECPIATALRLERDFTSYEFLVVTQKGNYKLLGLTTSRIYDPRSHVTGIIASFSDLTEMANMRQELQRHDRLAVIGELAAGLAHEIRNPVAAIRGAVDELQGNLNERVMAEKLTAIALRESDHLNQIVSGFLDFARKPSVHRETFDVRGLVWEAADWIERRYDMSRLTIKVTAPESICAVSGDRSQIRQVFLNIAKNGIEAMGEHGSLSVVVTQRASSVDVVFDDQGPGIEPDKVARIFEPFYTTKESGVGMGLAICLRIITAHDGTIRVNSRDGGGTSMVVRLPAAQRDAVRALEASLAAVPQQEEGESGEPLRDAS